MSSEYEEMKLQVEALGEAVSDLEDKANEAKEKMDSGKQALDDYREQNPAAAMGDETLEELAKVYFELHTAHTNAVLDCEQKRSECVALLRTMQEFLRRED